MQPTTSTSTAATDPQGPTGVLCNWLAAFSLQQAPQQARDRAKALTLDGIGCAIVGAKLPWSNTAAEIVQKFEGAGDRTIVGWGARTSAPGAALLNGTFIQGFELDDFHAKAPLHSASLVLPALWAASEGAEKVSGRQFLEAAIAGYEVGPRVGKALGGIAMLSRGWHSGAVFGTFAAAAAVGKLMQLDAARFEDALGLAGTQSAGLMAAQYEAMCKRMHHGFSSRNGLYSAVLAQGGYTGIKRVFEREYGGFLAVFGEGHNPDPSQVCKDLGSLWEVEHIVIKPYAAMGGIHSPLDALFDIGRQRALKANEIARVEVDVSHPIYHHGWWPPVRPLTSIGAQMNIGYCMAVAILDGEAVVRQFTPARIEAEDVWNLIPKVEVRNDPEFDEGGAEMRFRSRVAVTFTDGERIEVERHTSRTIEARQSIEEVAEKYCSLTDGLIDPERQRKIQEMVLDIEALDDVRELLALLAPPVGTAFE
ncbi:MmgE/PrpD family protein [Hydrogenophaga sp. BPS33]|uniref:MmgE/PrpD family protein n=1 Tax=Hydrogenophaga sp. BPS33 TaxID=2651974 RepID=UPI00131F5CE9|nr:MmgE/PrpD family protein [Hydrogenophaga sp. BPS33]QHE87483.1 MmgE/PrpD family protein [Hydrogenophaga sp. BPS33]